jgi:hypothetical protein
METKEDDNAQRPMETKSKRVSLEDFIPKVRQMTTFQKMHNTLYKDYATLLEITDSLKADQEKYATLGRTCIRNILSLMESDIFYFNLVDPYKNYEDRHAFVSKFKSTFKQICTTWQWTDVRKEYNDTKLKTLLEVKELRDRLVHPKQPTDIVEIDEAVMKKVREAFEDYETFIRKLMSNFFISTSIPMDSLFR